MPFLYHFFSPTNLPGQVLHLAEVLRDLNNRKRLLMTFRFLCPQGHVLQGEESQAGRQSRCPRCGSRFVIPEPVPAPPTETSAGIRPEVGQSGGGQPIGKQAASTPPAAPESLPVIRPEANPGSSRTSADAPAKLDLFGTRPPQFVHICCPSGHELETPWEMLGHEAMCPFCRVQFRLRLKDSVEYEQQKASQRQRKRRLGRTQLYWSVALAVAVLGSLILLIAIAT